MKSKNTKCFVEWMPLLISSLVAIIPICYKHFSIADTKDPGLTLMKNGETGIKLMFRNTKTQLDYGELVFPPNGDICYYYDSIAVNANTREDAIKTKKVGTISIALDPYKMGFDTDSFLYFSRLVSCNNIFEGKEFSLPFMVSLCYHYMDVKMHAVYLAHFDLCMRNDRIVINSWKFDDVRIEKFKDLDMKQDRNNCEEYRIIYSWRYK